MLSFCDNSVMKNLTELITKFPSAQSAANRPRRTARSAGRIRETDTRRRDAARFFVVRNTARRRNDVGLFPLPPAWTSTSTPSGNLARSYIAGGMTTTTSATPRRLRSSGRLTRQARGQHWMGRRLQDHRTRGRPRAFEQGLKSWKRPDKAGHSMARDFSKQMAVQRDRIAGVGFGT